MTVLKENEILSSWS